MAITCALPTLALQGARVRARARLPPWPAVSAPPLPLVPQAIYAGEAQIAAASMGLPEGWGACLSTSEPREIFFVHLASNATQWERPEANTGPTATEGAAAADLS